MAVRNLIRILSAAASAVTLVAYVRYRKEIREIRDCVDRGSTIAETVAGPIEYAEAGAGEPLLLIHGAGGGYDQGLLIARDFGEGHRVIAPSRFGYLKTPVPEDARSLARATLTDLAGGIDHALDEARDDLDEYTRAHLADSRERIARALDAPMVETASTR